MMADHALFADATGIERLREISQPPLDEPPEPLGTRPAPGPRAMHGLLAPHTRRLPFGRRWRGPH